MNKPLRRSPQASTASPQLLVALATVDGQLEPLELFLEHIPTTTNAAFVLAQEASDEGEPLDAERLGDITALTVEPVEGRVELEPGHLYVAPSDELVSVEQDALEPQEASQTSDIGRLDALLESAAQSWRSRSVAVALGDDNLQTLHGLTAVAEAGGMTLVQRPESRDEFAFDGGSYSQEVVDYLLSPDALAEELLAHERHLSHLAKSGEPRALKEAIEQALPRITDLLFEHTDRDFSEYKSSTLARRIQRRMQILRLEAPDEYIARLAKSPEEAHHLVDEILVGVSSFFREPQVFERLEAELLPELFETRRPGQPLRIWVPGCSTGQEAYSLGMLCAEYLERVDENVRVQIFASDIDEKAINQARHGRYPPSIADELSEERLERFFHKVSTGYEVVEKLRQMCLFSVHDVISDPAFSNLDLISCRNLLIYLNKPLQKKVLETFRFALEPSGYLLLGSSESVGENADAFEAVDSSLRVFRCEKPSRSRSERATNARIPAHMPSTSVARQRVNDAYSAMQRIILDRYAPRGVVIDKARKLICTSGQVDKYLALTRGSFENDVLEMARSGLRLGLRAALREAFDREKRVTQDNLSVDTESGVQPVRITVEPLRDPRSERDLFIVIFEDLGEAIQPADGPAAPDETNEIIVRLEQELSRAHQELDETVRELELSNEELRSSNEELLSMNEELQSTNEELETAKEEIQAANRSLARTNADLQNLLQSTQIATLFLDETLCIQRMTPAVRAIYNVQSTDVGRPLSDLTHCVKDMPPLPDLEEVTEEAAPIKDVLSTEEGRWYIRRVLPYLDEEGQKQGMVVTFVDITERRIAQDRENRLAAIVESSDDAILGKTLDGTITSWNRAAEKMYGYTADEIIGEHISTIVPEERHEELANIMEAIRNGDSVDLYETERVRKSGERVRISLTVSPIHGANDEIVGASAIARNVSERLEREKVLQQRNQALRNLNRMNRALASHLERQDLLQELTDYGTKLTDADFGAFVTAQKRDGLVESFDFTAESGLYPAEILQLPSLALDSILERVFEEQDVLRSVEADSDLPAKGLEEDSAPQEPPLRSYLAAPVVSREGETYGGLIFGHRSPEAFESQHEDLLSGLAAQASVALDNARLYEQLQAELDDHQRTQERLEEALAKAESANEAKTEFLANVSHEIRTPMSAVLGYTDVLMNHLEDPDNRQCVDTIRRNGEYLLEIINDLLDLSKIEAGKLELDKERVAPDQLVGEVLSLMSVRAQEKDIDLDVDFASPLPSAIETDPVRVRQILVNLVSNAVKFTQEGGVTLRVYYEEGEPNELIVEVIDTGIGMSREQQRELFEPFSRGDAPSNGGGGGTGLGLAICRRLVDMLGGQMGVESELNVGSTFTVRLPVGPPDDVVLSEPSPGIDKPEKPLSVSKVELDCRVLVVDDRRDIRFLATYYLEEAGARADAVEDGRQAFERIQQAVRDDDPYDAVILDMQMPVMDGYQTAQKLRRMGLKLPIIALTAAAMEQDRKRCLEAGCDAYLAKPIHADDLVGVVADHLEAARAAKDDSEQLQLTDAAIDEGVDAPQAADGLDEPADETARLLEPDELREDESASGEPRAPQGEKDEAEAPEEAPDDGECRILLVEDNADARNALSTLLELNDYEVDEASTGQKTLEKTDSQHFDAILLDLGLPDMSGFEVLERLQERGTDAETTVIALSGRSTAEDKERTSEAGFDHHIVKPASFDELEEHLPG